MIFKRFFTLLLVFFASAIDGIGEELDRNVMVEKAKVQFIWKNYDKALELAEKVLKEEPRNIEALIIVAQIHYINGRFEESKKTFDKIFEIDDALRVEFMRDYGIVLKSVGDFLRAKDYLEGYLKDNSEDSVARYHLADVYFRMGDKGRAEDEIKKVYSRKDDQMIPAAVLLSEIYLSEGRSDEAQNVLEKLEKERMSQLSEQIVSGLYGRASVARERFKKISLELSIRAGYDSNGIYLTEEEKEKKVAGDSVFSELYVEASFSPMMSAQKRLYIELSFLKSFYLKENVSQFDQLFVNPKIGYKFFTDDRRSTFLDLGYEYTNLFFAGGERVGFDSFGTYVQSNGLYGELNHRFGKTIGIARYVFSFDEYYDHSKSGFVHKIFLVSSIPVLKTGNLYMGPILSLEDKRLNLYDLYSVGATAGFRLKPLERLSFVISSNYENRNYFDNHEGRKDNVVILSSHIEGFITGSVFLSATASYSLFNSNLKMYSYDRWVILFGTGFYY
ncbi:MAG: tetratricopeptide repeat protein [Deltaproteobacteria bacterium]|nr:tetratricopeptide repeat protein [Deltaproteobacteria bacterium]